MLVFSFQFHFLEIFFLSTCQATIAKVYKSILDVQNKKKTKQNKKGTKNHANPIAIGATNLWNKNLN